jgi:pimeloyl-ACP methyl ester carboxylesterase
MLGAPMAPQPHILVEDAGEAAPLVISFGFALWKEPAAFDFVGRLRKLEFILGQRFHRIHLRDPSMSWYLQGIEGLGATLQATIDEVARRAQALAPTRVVTLGQSMGGYGAIRYGLALGAARIVAIGALSTMEPAVSRGRGDTRWLSVMERLAAQGVRGTDLVEFARGKRAPLDLRLHYGERPDAPGQGEVNLDLFHADRFAALPGCRVTRHPGSDHVVVNHLKATRQLDAVLLHDLFDIDPARLHRRTRPLLDDDWLRWIAENRLRGADLGSQIAAMVQRGIDPITARSAIAEVERDPVFLAASRLLATSSLSSGSCS